ncbi:MAG: hypothetical protein CVV47_02270 [Spirochaetae bacterium HGW-Spirochaetae-3]|jgi:HEAT repeat protein|nr:MAG: hypothetical protein CVV47_02270 [Spirochaetae bacterium HGW-Spirochaetae-3]
MNQFLESLSPSTIRLSAAIATAIVAVIALALVELRFRRAVREAAVRPEARRSAIGPLTLAARERHIVKRSERGFIGATGPFPELLTTLGYPARWLETLRDSGSRSAAARLLRFAPDLGLFDCFDSALRHAGVRKVLLAWMSAQGDGFTLRRIALSGPGREFDGAAAKAILADRMDEVRELLGDPEWAARAMAVRILALDDNERSKKGMADSLADPHPLVRRIALQAPLAGERLAFYAEAYRLFTIDPALEVRKAAKARIMAEFPDLYAPDMDALGTEEIIHVLELLDPTSGRDEEIAFRFLETGDPEQKLASAEYLEARGSLGPLLEEANPGDAEDFERRIRLLATAASFQVFGFLSVVDTMDKDGAFMAAARILAGGGDRRLIARMAARWFDRMGEGPYPNERIAIYRAVLSAIKARGDAEACKCLSSELSARRADRDLAAALLDSTDGSMDACVFSILTELFVDPDFPLRDELREALIKQPPEFIVPFALSFLRADRADTPRVLRRDALILAGQLKLTWALQRTMETLPTLDAYEIGSLAPIVVDADSKAFKRKARYILDGVDAPSRAAILAALPATGDKSFMSDVKAALRDADPDVRTAGVRALASFQEDKALTQGGLDLLRDPVERVRVAAASALAETSGGSVVKRLADVLADDNEVDDVKASVIKGLGRASDAASLDLLVDELGVREEWYAELAAALTQRSSRKDLARILERFKDATGELKTRITESVRAMGKRGEDALVELLGEEVVSFKPFIVEALESLGYVESRIRELKHRDPAVRRLSATALSLVGSRAAYRGIVLAARDPDQDVRVAVTRALERLAGPEGEAMLGELKNDPDPRVRKYVLWAMERVKAKAL